LKKTVISLILALGFSVVCNAQTSLNDYKYVIVEKQFHFQNDDNEYNLNELTRFLFKKHGFRPILTSDIYPDDLKSNYCLALTSEVIAKGAFTTKITIILKDCDNNILFTCEGKTKEKEFKKAYNIGIRNAFEHLKNINYKYIPNEDVIAKEDTSKDEIEELKAEIKSLKTEQSKIVQKADEDKKVVKNTAEEKQVEAEPIIGEKVQVQIQEDVKAEIEKVVKLDKEIPTLIIEKIEDIVVPIVDPEHFIHQGLITLTLNAQEIKSDPNTIIGYQLIDRESQKVMEIYYSGLPDLFIVKGEDAILFKKNKFWVYIKNNDRGNDGRAYIIKF